MGRQDASLSTPRRARLAEFLSGGDGELTPGELTDLVDEVLGPRRQGLLAAARRFGTPQYLVHADLLWRQATRFRAAFEGPGPTPGRPTARTHYAFKANPTACVVEILRDAGIAADVSSGLELDLALAVGFERIVFSGPAKSQAELERAVAHADRITVHLDSFDELERLDAVARRAGRTVVAGARLSLAAHGAWTKFGIPGAALPEMVERAARCRRVRLQGVQFHLSWQRQGAGYEQTLAELGPQLAACRPAGGWRFLDVGGGFYPEGDEAVYPWLTPRARLLALLDGVAEAPPVDWDGRYLLHRVQPIEAMARQLLEAWARCIAPTGDGIELWLEPGRYLVNPAVSILLQVADVKSPEVAITDGGTNLFGWERLEGEHVPLVNLTRPARTQRLGRVYGSLCTPHDLWGYGCYAAGLEVGDILVLPAQGAYVQTLAQRFIKPVCQTIVERRDGTLQRAQPHEAFADRYRPLADDLAAADLGPQLAEAAPEAPVT